MEFLRKKYQINPTTLRIEQARLPLKKRLFIGIIASVLILTMSVGMRILYDYNAKSPRLVYHENKNNFLRSEYNALSLELMKDEQLLSNFQRKDDRMYRSVFEMDPLPASIREAGTGGAEMHPSLRLISKPEGIIEAFERMDKVLSKAMIQSSSFADLEEAAVLKKDLVDKKPTIMPLNPYKPHWLTSSFGYRADPFHGRKTYHHGIDLSGPVGLDIYATGDGVVELAEFNRFGYGKEVLIDHSYGYLSRYAHLDEILVEPGEVVKKGQVIGKLGDTGRSTGPHLHYEIRFQNKAVNPFYYFFDELSEKEFHEILDKAVSN